MAQILIVEDEVLLAKSLSRFMVSRGHDCLTAVTAEEGLALLEKVSVDVLLLDIQLPGMSGMEAIKLVRKYDPNVSIIMATAYGTMASVVEAMRAGACDFLRKPLDTEEVFLAVERAVACFKLKQTVYYYQSVEAKKTDEDELICDSPKMKHVGEQVDKLVSVNLEKASDHPPILLLGEIGVGKGIIARYLHFRGKFSGQPYVEVNCATLSNGLEEAELFGYENGSMAGAFHHKRGPFEAAAGGSIFLNGIEHLSQEVQVKLLQVIEQKSFRRIGGLRDLSAEVRIIAATSRDLKNQNEFRSDLYNRFKNSTLEVPPLRERTKDIVKLAELFLTKFGKKYGTTKKLDPSARQALLEYAWYGNVRELRQLMERVTFFSPSTIISAEDLKLTATKKAFPVGSNSNDFPVESPDEGNDWKKLKKI